MSVDLEAAKTRLAFYSSAAAQIEVMAEWFELLETSVAMTSRLRTLAGEIRLKAEISRHPESRAWAVMKWTEYRNPDHRESYRQALEHSRHLPGLRGYNPVAATLRRCGVKVSDPFRSDLIQRLTEAALGR
jgi:hypothetical protein